jgi:hypothetical protein
MNNTDNWQSLLRSTIKIIGAVIVTLGFASAGQVDVISTAVLEFVGAAITIVGLFMSLWHHTPDAAPAATSIGFAEKV